MDRLLQIGFRPIGRWELQGSELRLRLDALPTHRRALYAFVTGTTVLYVGKTAGALPTRLAGYLSPHPTQRTNVRNHASLRAILNVGQPVEILGWIDPGLQRIGAFDLNMAAGLEDSIIAVLAPPWNGSRAPSLVSASVLQPAVLPTVPMAAAPEASPSAESNVPSRACEQLGAAQQMAPKVSLVASRVSFKVRLGKTYYNEGFFNVPVAFSQHFAGHGAQLKLYCGTERALLMGVLDRKANQSSKTPRIYGKAELARWVQRRLNIGDFLEVTVVSPDEVLLN
jgi:hypothetical protein